MTHLIRIQYGTFEPLEITINKGDTVQWINEDLHNEHNVISDLFNSPVLKFRNDFSFTFNKVGEWEYRSDFATYLKAIVRVIE